MDIAECREYNMKLRQVLWAFASHGEAIDKVAYKLALQLFRMFSTFHNLNLLEEFSQLGHVPQQAYKEPHTSVLSSAPIPDKIGKPHNQHVVYYLVLWEGQCESKAT